MFKVALIGLGNMGELHLRNCRVIDGTRVNAIADKSKSSQRKARSYGVHRVYSDYRELLTKEEADVVVVTVPNFLHKDCVTLAAESGKDIFVEKPLANTVRECEEIKRAVQKNGVRLMIGHNFRFFDCVTEVKKLIDEGVLGDIKIVTFEYVCNGPFTSSSEPRRIPEWYFEKEKLGLGIMDTGYHLIDLQHWLLREEPRILFAGFDHVYQLPYEDSATITSMSGKTRCVTNVGWFCHSKLPVDENFRMVLHGTAGFISTDKLTPNPYFHAIKEGAKNILRRMIGKKIHPLSYAYWSSSYYRELRCFFDCLKEDKPLPITVEDGLKTVKTIEDIYAKNLKSLR